MYSKKISYNVSGHAFFKYSIVVTIGIALVIFYVWQNVEVMKIKLKYKEEVERQKKIIIENDRLIYEIEKFQNQELIEKIALENGMKEIEYNDVIVVRKENNQ